MKISSKISLLNLFSIILLCAFGLEAFAQTSKDFTVQARVEVNKANHSITIKWPLLTDVVNYKIYRKLKTETSWGSTTKGVAAGSDTMWTDTDVTIGTEYEYYIEKIKADLSNGYTYILSGIEVPAVDNRGNVLVVVEKTLAETINTELNSYLKDLAADGWNVFSIAVSKTDSIQAVKRGIKKMDTQVGGLKSLIILGHVPVPYSGNFAPDGHGDHSGVWPTDAYYTIDYDQWSDAITKVSGITRTENQNLPNDGKWDNSVLPGAVKYQTGRIDLSNMSKFSKTEAELTKQYIKKDHDFRYKITKTVEKGVVDDNFSYTLGSFGSTGWRNFSVMFGPKNVSDQDYFTACRKENILFGYGAGGGTYQSCDGIGTTDSFVNAKGAIFNMLFGSYFGDWDNANNLLRAPLASAQNGLTVAWSGRPYWENHAMALGESIGYCAKITQNNKGTYQDNLYKNTVPIELMGDPTLRLHIIAPPTNVNASAQNNNTEVNLSWTASDESSITGYSIYHSNKPDGNYTLINSTPVTETSFIDKSASDTNYYFVKTLKLTTSASGSYFNLSQGIPVYISGITIKESLTVITKDTTIYLDSTGVASISASEIDNGSFSTCCSISNFDLDKSSFNYTAIGDNSVILTVTDANKNSDTGVAIVTVIDAIGPTVITHDITLSLTNGMATITADDINNGSYDNCSITSVSVSPTSFNCNNIGINTVTLTVTDVNGNISEGTAIVTISGTISSISITQNNQPEFYQGGLIVLKTSVTETATYRWSNAATTESINVNASGKYSVIVKFANGCSATAKTTVNYDATSLTSSYSILVSGEAILRNTSIVKSGSVGSTGSAGRIEVNTNSLITASNIFAKAINVTATTGGKITKAYTTNAAQVNLPEFINNPYCSSNNNITVKTNARVTLTDSIFGNIVIGSGAKVTFTHPVIYANKITTSSKATLIFSTCTKIILCNPTIIADNNIINYENKSIVFYSPASIQINKHTVFNASVYTKDKLETFGSKSERINFNGQIIALNHYSDYSDFYWNTTFGSCGTLNKESLINDELAENIVNSNANEVTVYPNPTNGNTTVRIISNTSETIKVKITNITGETLFTTEKTIVNGFNEMPLDLANYTSGMYFIITEYANKIKTTRINKINSNIN